MIGSQRAFRFPLKEKHVFASYLCTGNEQLVATLQAPLQGSQFSMIWVSGLPGSGRSHLLQATCQYHDETAAYLPAEEIENVDALTDGLSDYSLVAVDNIDFWLPSLASERSILGFYTALQQSNARLVVTANAPPAQTCFALADLASRANASDSFRLSPLPDDNLVELLIVRARERGLTLEAESAHYWLHRRQRNLSSLLDDLSLLDQASLEKARRLTIPFIRQMLKL